ncbi:MAG: hypothetical protein RIR11_1713 [Bacteroidota bacterium]|jgi:hypothetical protein
MSFDAFYSAHIEPLYIAAIDLVRLQKARAQIWQFVWMLLTSIVVGLSFYFLLNDITTAWVTFVLLLLCSEIFYIQAYPYPDFEKPNITVYIAVVILCVAGGGIIIAAFHASEVSLFLVGWIPLLVSGAITVMQSPHRAALLRPYAALKEEVISLFLKHLYPGFSLLPPPNVSARTLRELEIFDDATDVVDCGIAIGGKIDDYSVAIQKVKLIRISKDSKGNTSRSTVFDGFWMYLPKICNNMVPVIVQKHRSTGFISLFLENTRRIEMEDTEFEQQFDVITSSEFEARRILTPALMEQLSGFSKGEFPLHGIYFGLDQTHIAIKSPHVMFEDNFANNTAVKEGLSKSRALLDMQMEIILALTRK